MYYRYFNLEKNPFQFNSDNTFLWLGKKHSMALKLLKKGMAEKQGLLVLTGDIGTGKTVLVNEIIHTLDADTCFVKIVDPCLERQYVFEDLALELGFKDQYTGEENFSLELFSFLQAADQEGKKVLVIVDEAQSMPGWFLREVVSWSSFGLNGTLTVILAGQLAFEDVIKSNLGPEWKESIETHAFLEPLNEEETKGYINKRLELAGTYRKIFLVSAIHEIYAYSKGIPRLINTTCDQALITAYANGTKIIDGPTIKKVTGQLTLPSDPPENQTQDQELLTQNVEQPAPIEEHPQKTIKPAQEVQHRQQTPRRNMVWKSVFASICLFIAYLFYAGYIPSNIKDDPFHLPENMEILEKPVEKSSPVETPASSPLIDHMEQPLTQTPQPIITEPEQPAALEIGLGYTPPSSPGNREELLPELPIEIEKKHETAKPVKDKTQDMDIAAEEMVSLKEQTDTIPEVVVETQTIEELTQVVEGSLTEPDIEPAGSETIKDAAQDTETSVEETVSLKEQTDTIPEPVLETETTEELNQVVEGSLTEPDIEPAAPETIKDAAQDTDTSVEETVSLKEHTDTIPEPAVETETIENLSRAVEKILTEPDEDPAIEENDDYPDSVEEPEPDAIIDWLIEKKMSR